MGTHLLEHVLPIGELGWRVVGQRARDVRHVDVACGPVGQAEVIVLGEQDGVAGDGCGKGRGGKAEEARQRRYGGGVSQSCVCV